MSDHRQGNYSYEDYDALVRRAHAERAEYLGALMGRAIAALRALLQRKPGPQKTTHGAPLAGSAKA